MVIVDRQDYVKKMNDILSDQKKFCKVSLKDDILLNYRKWKIQQNVPSWL